MPDVRTITIEQVDALEQLWRQMCGECRVNGTNVRATVDAAHPETARYLLRLQELGAPLIRAAREFVEIVGPIGRLLRERGDSVELFCDPGHAAFIRVSGPWTRDRSCRFDGETLADALAAAVAVRTHQEETTNDANDAKGGGDGREQN